MKPPVLTPEQEKTLAEADFETLCGFYNELHDGAGANLEILRLYTHLNKLMADKANEESKENMIKFKEGTNDAQ